MSDADHARVSEIFIEACGLPPDRREAYLDAATKGDPTLRAEVESLLAHDESVPEILNDGAMPFESGSAAEPVPERIGQFRILGRNHAAAHGVDRFRGLEAEVGEATEGAGLSTSE